MRTERIGRLCPALQDLINGFDLGSEQESFSSNRSDIDAVIFPLACLSCGSPHLQALISSASTDGADPQKPCSFHGHSKQKIDGTRPDTI